MDTAGSWGRGVKKCKSKVGGGIASIRGECLPPQGRRDFTESELLCHRPLPFDGTTSSGLGNSDTNIWMPSRGLVGAGTWKFIVN